MAVRTRVFVGEQKVSGEEEFDGLDAESTHVVALDENGVVATCRLRWLEGDVCKLERMAVEERSRGARASGRRLVEGSERIARERGAAADGAERPAPGRGLLREPGLRGRGRDLHGGGHRARADDEGSCEPPSPPRSGSTSSTGLRTILAAGRADRPINFTPASPGRRGPRRAARSAKGRSRRPRSRSGPTGPEGEAEHARAGACARCPNLYPAVGLPEGAEGPDGAAERRRRRRCATRCAPRRASASRTSSPARPAGGAHEVIVSTPRHVDLARRARRRRARGGRRRLAGADARPRGRVAACS